MGAHMIINLYPISQLCWWVTVYCDLISVDDQIRPQPCRTRLDLALWRAGLSKLGAKEENLRIGQSCFTPDTWPSQ